VFRRWAFQELQACICICKGRANSPAGPPPQTIRAQGGTAEAVIGVDQQGTSVQALKLALAELDRVLIWHHPSPFTTFHPKLYIFDGKH